MSSRPRSIALDELEIVAYADVATAELLPAVVAPVYRIVGSETFVFPPFQELEGFLLGGVDGRARELETLEAKGEATRVAPPFRAQPRHALWIAENGQLHYEPWQDVETTLRRIAIDAIEAARAALAKHDLDEADLCAGRALAADDRLMDGLAIKAAVRRLRNDDEGVDLMRHFASNQCTESLFDRSVSELVEEAARQSSASPQGKLSGIAAVPAAA